MSCSIDFEYPLEHCLIAKDHESPGNLRFIRGVSLKHCLLETSSSSFGSRKSEGRDHLGRNAANLVVVLFKRLDGERNGILVFEPCKLKQAFLLQLVFIGLRSPLAPLYSGGFARELEDVLLHIDDLLNGH